MSIRKLWGYLKTKPRSDTVTYNYNICIYAQLRTRTHVYIDVAIVFDVDVGYGFNCTSNSTNGTPKKKQTTAHCCWCAKTQISYCYGISLLLTLHISDHRPMQISK